MRNAQISVVGSGAVGLYYGGRLAEHGFSVNFLARSGYQTLKNNGLTVQSCHGDFHLSPERFNVYSDAAQMPVADLVIVALKSTAQAEYYKLVKPLVGPGTLILCLQNGFGNEERFLDLVPESQIAGGIAYTCINRLSVDAVSHTSHGHVRIGMLNQPVNSRLHEIADWMKQSKIQVEVVDDLHFYRWDKLVWNIPFNGLGALYDLHSQALLASEEGHELIRRVMKMVVRMAHGCGAKLDESCVEMQIKRTYEMGAYYSSMQIDRREKRPMEINAIISEPLRRARKAGVAQIDDLIRIEEGLKIIDQATKL